MKNLTLQDPKTFDIPNKEKVKNVIKLFQSEDKEQFINSSQSFVDPPFILIFV